MKIFSNFDTELSRTLLKEAAKKYGDEYVLRVRRGRIYLFLRMFFPIILWLFLSSLFLWIHYGFIGTKVSISDEVGFVVWALVISMTIYLLIFFLRKVMNFYMDFVIVTPDQLTSYDQEGILTRTTRSLELSKIKTINVMTDGWMSSLFSYGSIVFLAEGDMINGDIKLNFITNPAHLRNTIYNLIERREGLREEDVTVQNKNNEIDGYS